jgi:uncharacterized protein (TIGR02284 family)
VIVHDVISTLRDLLATCRDSEEGFGKAAKGVHSDNLRHRFTGIAGQRADFAEELSARLKQLGDEPPESGHQSGIQHRGWRELEERIRRPKDDTDVILDCENGEDNTLRHYEQALTRDLPPPVRAMVERHRLAVQEALLELRNLEYLGKAS